MNVFALLVLAASAAAPTATPAPSPKIPAFVRFHGTPSLDDAAAGRLLLGELNCTGCHNADAAFNEHITPKKAPVLSEVGSRVRPEWIRKLLTDPQQVKPGTTMPDVLVGLPEREKARRVEALTHYLASTSPDGVTDRFIDKASIGRGEKSFHEVGCTACHGSRRDKEGVEPLPFMLTLRNPAAKYTAASLAAFLQDPHKVRPSGRMPSLNLLPEEARDIASYFLKDVIPPPNFAYELYDGRWDNIPDWSNFKPKKTGEIAGLDLSPAGDMKRFGMIFRGYFKLDKDSNMPFKLSSDDGSRLYIDDVLIIDNDGIHPMQDREGKAVLKAGVHKIRIEYFNGGLGAELDAEFRYSGKETWRNLGSIVSLKPDGTPPGDGRFTVDPQLAAEGRKLFVSSGCASCHEMNDGKEKLASTVKAKRLTQLTAGKGCAANKNEAKGDAASPNFSLSAAQQKAVDAALRWVAEAQLDGKPQPPTAAAKLKHSLATFNCYACHRRDAVGGVDTTPGLDLNDDGVPDVDPNAERLASLFSSTVPEMGDEGRLPPRLDNVGAKMSDAWLKQTLQNGAKERPYMKAVMPKFGAGVDKLAAVFKELDKPADYVPVEFSEPAYRVKADGRLLVGTKGFSCVKCHNFNKQKAEGIPGIDLTILAKRVRPEWFARYVRDPQQIRPGTRMPTVFPQGKSPLPDLYGGDVDKQIAALWAYLSDGDKAAVPVGVGGTPIELVAQSEPIMYRNFIADVGPRAIAVAFPEKANYCFDANDLRPGLIWHGAFIDAAKHWSGRGQGFQPPLGDDVVRLAAGPNFAKLKDADEPWPTKTAKELGQHFRGYRLETDRRPVFNYELEGGATVTDDYRPVKGAKQPGLLRVLNIYAPKAADDLWFRAVSAKEIKPAADGWYSVDGLWRVRIAAGGEKPIIRSGPNGQELIVRVPHGGDARSIIEQEFAW